MFRHETHLRIERLAVGDDIVGALVLSDQQRFTWRPPTGFAGSLTVSNNELLLVHARGATQRIRRLSQCRLRSSTPSSAHARPLQGGLRPTDAAVVVAGAAAEHLSLVPQGEQVHQVSRDGVRQQSWAGNKKAALQHPFQFDHATSPPGTEPMQAPMVLLRLAQMRPMYDSLGRQGRSYGYQRAQCNDSHDRRHQVLQ
ncbi:MAG: hypothetical protein HHJ14_09750 [Cellulomonas sp.]|nr:hypothetical protein [Cellulomonas sp.]